MILLHGGPGLPHDYLEAMESFLPQTGIEMYYYDQLGVGNSDVPDDPALWTLPRYLGEVEEVRRGLGLDHFVLYGHSWDCPHINILLRKIDISKSESATAIARIAELDKSAGRWADS